MNAENIKLGCLGKISVYYPSNVLDDVDEFTLTLFNTVEKAESISSNVNISKPLYNFINNKSVQTIQLPVCKKPPIKNYPRCAFPLSVMFVNKKERYNIFILDQFIELMAEPLCNTLDYHNYHYKYWKCIEQYQIGRDVIRFNNIDILSYIYNGLMNEFYIDIWLDSYFIPGKPAYGYTHLSHGLLIYGYDCVNKEFNTLTFTDKNHYEELNVKPEDILRACTTNYFLYITLLKRNEITRLIYDIRSIRDKLYKYLYSINYNSGGFKVWTEYSNLQYGQNASRWFKNYVYEMGLKKERINMVNAFTFVEHKKCMAWRIETIVKKEKLIYPNIDLYVSATNSLCELIINLCLKYNDTAKIKIIDSLANKIEHIIDLECNSITTLLKELDSKFENTSQK